MSEKYNSVLTAFRLQWRKVFFEKKRRKTMAVNYNL